MGIILVEESSIEEDRIFSISIENDAKDFKLEDGYYKLFFDHNVLYQKIELIEKISVEVDSSFIAFVPKDFIKVSSSDGERVEKLIDMLEELEDVQNVYSNYEIEQSS
jgi:transcriptional/translational regulatory protein YebC/TACO1